MQFFNNKILKMKKINIIIKAFLLLFLITSCEDNDMPKEGGTVVTAPVISSLASSDLILSKPADGQNPFVFRLNWSKVRYNYGSGQFIAADDVKYKVQMDLNDNDFSKAKTIAETENLYTDLYTVDFKEFIDEIVGEETNTAHTFSVRIKATSSKGEAFSETVILNITSYLNVDPTVKNIYIIGDMNGWNNSSKDYVMFRTTNDYQDGVYTYTGYFPAATYFKFNSEEFLGSFDHMYCAGANGILEQGDKGAFYIAGGYHTISIDVKNMTWTISDPAINNPTVYSQMGPIGGFCNWDNEPMMTKSTFDPHQWKMTYEFSESTACKFRGNKDWANNWGGKDADVPYGKGIFDGPGATIQNAGNYDIYFNDLTGHYAIIKH